MVLLMYSVSFSIAGQPRVNALEEEQAPHALNLLDDSLDCFVN